jgi:hypothetical protein
MDHLAETLEEFQITLEGGERLIVMHHLAGTLEEKEGVILCL